MILPLAEPDLAGRHGVVPPRDRPLRPTRYREDHFRQRDRLALGLAVELLPAELAAEGTERQAKLLADAFERVLELVSAVVFVDEVEDLAATRHEERRVSPSITNEFLKQIPRLREAQRHLLACATNGSPVRPRLPAPRSLRLRAPGRAAERGRAPADLAPLRGGDHRRVSTSTRSCRRASCSPRASSSPRASPLSERSSASTSREHDSAPERTTSSPRSAKQDDAHSRDRHELRGGDAPVRPLLTVRTASAACLPAISASSGRRRARSAGRWE